MELANLVWGNYYSQIESGKRIADLCSLSEYETEIRFYK